MTTEREANPVKKGDMAVLRQSRTEHMPGWITSQTKYTLIKVEAATRSGRAKTVRTNPIGAAQDLKYMPYQPQVYALGATGQEPALIEAFEGSGLQGVELGTTESEARDAVKRIIDAQKSG